ncbi:Glycosyl hydrolases family 2, sugar binding domain [Chryseobacterium soldanellicola]|uniref:Glycosyl hydrolases family 2, sugar binding domain n=1 Tax=Chryseobacterium soldanellicola TaxID=311333 RepID=A0A1H1GR98_9FLAO|nr:glycosyl hydrolase [Chryseobacterium soldanellicola]SDR15603.1 Glycosyl hydrolases family 2, sugar binding domain [Chryseobacterium soldanellicola]
MKITNIISLSLICFAFGNLSAQNPWPKTTETAKPWTRWWWMGNAVDEKGLDKQLTTLNKAGFGGIEIVPIYGAKGFENQYINYLSPEWMKMLQFTTNKAKSLNMGVDMAVGTGWPIGGPQVSEEDAATKMIVQTYTISSGEKFSEKIVLNDEKLKNLKTIKLDIATAYNEKNEAVVLTDKITNEGSLNWKPDSGKWAIYAVFTGKTLQKVKRAAPGGEGYTLDHFSPVATVNYLKTFDKAFGNSNYGVRSFFNDSYEVYNADWTPDFKNEFKKRRGYDLSPYIKYLINNDENEITTRVKSDYRQTLSELILHNFADNFTNWAHSKNSKNTNQAHGSPGNLLDLYAAVDIPESETFGSSIFEIPGLRRDSADIQKSDMPDFNMLKFASSAANVTGKKLTSNETFTWLTEHFKTSWSQAKPEVEQVFLSGINHVFYHGTTYTPADVPFPGWLFYASVNFVPENSLWPHLKGLNSYIERTQSVLQSGKSDNELLMYWPIYDQWATPKGKDIAFKVHNVEKWLQPTPFYDDLKKLGKMGYSLDMISDKIISESKSENQKIQTGKEGSSYQVLIIPELTYLPETTLGDILKLAQNGALIIFQNEPKDVPGNFEVEKRRNQLKSLWNQILFQNQGENVKIASFGKGKIVLSSDVEKGLEYLKIQREKLTDTGLKFIRRQFDGGKYYYIVNHTSKEINQFVPINYTGKQTTIMNPENGDFGVAEMQNNSVRIQLKSGESLILKNSEAVESSISKWKYTEKADAPIILDQAWQLSFKEGGPELPKSRNLKKLEPWTNFSDDPATQSFSGTGIYTTTLNIKKNADDYLLKFDKLYESAKVIVNGQDAGIVWSIPFEINIGKYLKKGKNTIQIEVCNLMANRIRYMDQKKMVWRNYNEINFVNIDYKAFDASNWKVQPSGLDGEIQIIPLYWTK